MAKEHFSKKLFTTQTYQIETSPKEEWGYVAEKNPIPADKMAFGRRARDSDELLSLDKKKAANIRANLIKAEIIAVILYTGPMVIPHIITLALNCCCITDFLFSVYALQLGVAQMAQGKF